MQRIPRPSQARSQQALERFLNVAAELLQSNQFEDTGIAQIAQQAESSVGTFYRLIGDKDLLLYAVHQRFVEQSRAAIDQLNETLLSQPLDLFSQTERYISQVLTLFHGREGLLRALIRRSSSDMQFRQRFHELNAYIAQSFSLLTLARLQGRKHANPAQAADLLAHVLLASMNYHTLTGQLGRTPNAQLPAELARMVCSYLHNDLADAE